MLSLLFLFEETTAPILDFRYSCIGWNIEHIRSSAYKNRESIVLSEYINLIRNHNDIVI